MFVSPSGLTMNLKDLGRLGAAFLMGGSSNPPAFSQIALLQTSPVFSDTFVQDHDGSD